MAKGIDPYYDASKKQRVWWLDWCRTQSVWNVLCGHAWWSACDETAYGATRVRWTDLGDIGNNKEASRGSITDRVWNGHILFSNVYMNYNDDGLTAHDGRLKETSNMLEYVVDQGALHTIPLFFLLSGYVSAFACSARKRDAFSRFLTLWSDAQCSDRAQESEDYYYGGEPTTNSGGKKEAEKIRFVGMDEYLEHMAQDTSRIGEASFPRFVYRRFIRLILPWIFGTLCSVLPRAALLDQVTANGVLLSQMYFLFVLFAFAVANFAWCRWLHVFKELFELRFAQAVERVKLRSCTASEGAATRAGTLKKMMLLPTIANVVILIVIPLVAIHVFHDRDMPLIWGLIPIISFLLSATCLFGALVIVGQVASEVGLQLACLCVTLSVLQFIAMTFIMMTPELIVGDEFDWLSENMWLPFLFFEILYVFGYTWRVFEDYIYFWYKAWLKPHFIGVSLLLLSAAWPLATFWGARSTRRIGPWMSFYDDSQRLWGMFRTWSWMVILVGFAVNFANGPVSPRFHIHFTQSAMILYIFHRLFEQIILEAVKGSLKAPEDTIDRFGLFIIFIAFSLCCSFLTYFLLQLHWTLRLAFGVDAVDRLKKGGSEELKDAPNEQKKASGEGSGVERIIDRNENTEQEACQSGKVASACA